MSPEQVRGKELDARTDLFSFARCCMRWRRALCLFTAKPLVSSSKPYSILIRRPDSFNRDIPPKLEDIINRALEKDRNLRYQHARDAAELQRLKRDTETGRMPSASSGRVASLQESGTQAAITQATSPSGSAPAVTTSASTAAAAKLLKFRYPKRQPLEDRNSLSCLARRLNCYGLYYRSHRAKPLTTKTPSFFADFANITGDPVFDDTLKTALSVSLNQSPFLNVLPDNKVAVTLH